MTEFWAPFRQTNLSVLYGDVRLIGDSDDNREGNIGIGYRRIEKLPFTGHGIIGFHGWIDRRLTRYGSAFHQFTIGGEWLSDPVDLLVNAYIPLNNARLVIIPNPNPSGPRLIGTGLFVSSDGRLIEDPQAGVDFEAGVRLGHYFNVPESLDSVRVYAGGYYFDGDHTKKTAGWRVRVAGDVTRNLSAGGRLQHDASRGFQAIMEATLRFPSFSKLPKKDGNNIDALYSRLDESPERDIDIVVGEQFTPPDNNVPVLNKASGQRQEILHVDNLAAGGGDGSVENPYNTLSAAITNASDHTIVYVHEGDGSSTGQNNGAVLSNAGMSLIGSGTDFLYDNGKFKTLNGRFIADGTVIAAATSAPVITNTAINGDGITIAANDVSVSGLTVDGANRDGIVIDSLNGVSPVLGASLDHVAVLNNNRQGLYIHATNAGEVSAQVQNSVFSGNAQHGIAVQDDTGATFNVDLGGGTLSSVGRNAILGNGLEDLALDYDGQIISAQNNWWGQSGGPTASQIYIGFIQDDPLSQNLVSHQTFDANELSGTISDDRSGSGNDGVLNGGFTAGNASAGIVGQALSFNGTSDFICLDNAGTCSGSDSNTSFDDAITARSVAIWFNAVDASATQILFEEGGGVNGFNLYLDGGNVYGGAWSETTGWNGVFIPSATTNGTWHQAIVTFDTGATQLFVDGSLISSSGGGSATISAHTGDDAIGSLRSDSKIQSGDLSGNARYFQGSLDDFRVYNYAIDGTEAARLYSLGNSRIDSSSALGSAP